MSSRDLLTPNAIIVRVDAKKGTGMIIVLDGAAAVDAVYDVRSHERGDEILGALIRGCQPPRFHRRPDRPSVKTQPGQVPGRES